MNPKPRKSFFRLTSYDLFFILPFVVLSLQHWQRLLLDGDTGYHIRAGEYLLQGNPIPKADIFSFLTPALPWTAHEWLSEIIMAWFHSFSGLTGMTLFFIFLISAVFALIYRWNRTENNLVFAVLIATAAMVSMFSHLLARPHLFTLLLTVLAYYALDTFQAREKKYVYAVIPLMLLWVNLHGGFIIGFILLGIYLFGNGWVRKFGPRTEREAAVSKMKMLGKVILGCILVSGINPYGYSILLFPFKNVFDKVLMDHVLEYLSPDFHEGFVLEMMFLLVILVLAVKKKPLHVIETLLLLFFTHMALFSVRHISLLAIIAAPILIRHLEPQLETASGWGARLKEISNSVSKIEGKRSFSVWPLAVVLIVVFVIKVQGLEYRFENESLSEEAVGFLKKEKLQGPFFNVDSFGDSLIYELWPDYKVFFDGRSDMYGAERIEEYQKVRRVHPDWKEIFKKYGFRWVLEKKDSPLSTVLDIHPDWELVYSDKTANIFVKS